MKKINLLIIVLIFICLINTSIIRSSTTYSLNIFINSIFLTSFPFLILSHIYVHLNIVPSKLISNIFSYILNINPSSFNIIFLSMLCGYPSSAVYIKEYLNNKNISIEESTKLLICASFPNPMFVIGTIGTSLFKSSSTALVLLIISYISNLLIGILIRNKYPKYIKNYETISNNENMPLIIKNSIISSINTLLLILGNITIFIIILNLIMHYFVDIHLLKIIISMSLEMTSSIILINNTITNSVLKYALISFAINFGGISILSQVLSILSNYNINKKEIITYRLLVSLVSFLLTIIYFSIKFFVII
ncbi:MAG: hypothetical protein RSD96_03080 [Bacilli bacterium]